MSGALLTLVMSWGGVSAHPGAGAHPAELRLCLWWSGDGTGSQARGGVLRCASGGGDTTTAAPQDSYNLLHKRINHTWDFVVMQAREQLR